MLRQPAVAGTFYPASPSTLKKTIADCVDSQAVREKAVAVVVPHAGYKYSGRLAGATYSRVDLPRRFIILSPNHTGLGAPGAVWPEGEWQTPLGAAPIDAGLTAALLKGCSALRADEEAHRGEHSLEVQIPFLQQLVGDFTFAAVTLMRGNLDTLKSIGEAIAQIVREADEEILIIASSDMNHYENQKTTEEKDRKAIEQIVALDAMGLFETVRDHRISMCGVIPATIALVASHALGASRATLVGHATSGDVTGDYGSVVGYAGLIIS